MLIIRKQCIHKGTGEGECLQRMVNEFMQIGPPLSMLDVRMVPKCDIYETHDAVLIFIELPGVEERDIQIAFDIEHNVIAIYGRRENPMGETRKRIHQKETVTGPFEKMLKINIPVDTEGVTARLNNGMLKIELPKA